MQTVVEVGVDCKWLLESESKKKEIEAINDITGMVIILLATTILLFLLP
jgi:hypothetical protein